MATPFKVGCITTWRTNVGDDFVREGIRALLDSLIEYEAYVVNKHFPDQTCKEALEGDGTQPVNDKLLDADLIVQCGAPVYWNLGDGAQQRCSNADWTEPLWYRRIGAVYERKPVWNIAAGACQRYYGSAAEIANQAECAQFVRDIHRFCAVTTVRDRMALELHELLELKVPLLPCSSIHSWRRFASAQPEWSAGKSEDRIVALNFMPIGGHYDLQENIDARDWLRRFREIASLLERTNQRYELVAHNMEEFDALREALPGHPVFFSPDYRDYYDFYRRCSAGIFNRVHGALVLAGRGCPTVVVGNDSRTRMMDEVGLPRFHVCEVEPRTVFDALMNLCESGSTQERLLELENRSWLSYRSLLAAHLPTPPASSG